MSLPKQAVLIGPASEIRKAVQGRLETLGLRCLADEGGRAESILRTTRRVSFVFIDGRDAVENATWVKCARGAHPHAAIAWLAPPKRPPVEVRGLVNAIIEESLPGPVVRVAEASLAATLFPPRIVDVLREAVQATLKQQFGLTLPPAPPELRGEYEPRDELAVVVAFSSAALAGHLTLFASGALLEELMVDAHRTRSPGDEIAVELTNLIAGHMRSLLLRNLSDFNYKIPTRWSPSSRLSMGSPPALVLPVSRGAQRLALELRIHHLDPSGLTRETSQVVLPPGSLSFFE